MLRDGVTEMKETFANIKNTLFGRKSSSMGESNADRSYSREDYVELDNASGGGDIRGKLLVRQFVMEEFEDIKDILTCLREGGTIALINIQPLKDKDIVELKRAVNKLKKTCDAIRGDIAGFGEDYVIATPESAAVYRQSSGSSSSSSPEMDDDEYE